MFKPKTVIFSLDMNLDNKLPPLVGWTLGDTVSLSFLNINSQ